MRSLLQLYHDKRVFEDSREALREAKDALDEILKKNPSFIMLKPRLDFLLKRQSDFESAYALEYLQRVKPIKDANMGYLPLILIGVGTLALLTTYGTSKAIEHINASKAEQERLELIRSLQDSGMSMDEILTIVGEAGDGSPAGLIDTITSYAKVFLGLSVSVVVLYLILKAVKK